MIALALLAAIAMGCRQTGLRRDVWSAPMPTVRISTLSPSNDAVEDEATSTPVRADEPLAKNPPPEGVVLPTALRQAVVRPGTEATSYHWFAEFDVETGAPEVKQAMTEGAETPVHAWLAVYAERVRAAGYEPTNYGIGFGYQPVSHGKPVSVMVRPVGEGAVPNPSTTRIEMTVGPQGG